MPKAIDAQSNFTLEEAAALIIYGHWLGQRISDKGLEGIPALSTAATIKGLAVIADQLDAELQKARAEIERLRPALRHYSNIHHYDTAGRVWTGNPDEDAPHEVDMGDIARAALAEAGEG